MRRRRHDRHSRPARERDELPLECGKRSGDGIDGTEPGSLGHDRIRKADRSGDGHCNRDDDALGDTDTGADRRGDGSRCCRNDESDQTHRDHDSRKSLVR